MDTGFTSPLQMLVPQQGKDWTSPKWDGPASTPSKSYGRPTGDGIGATRHSTSTTAVKQFWSSPTRRDSIIADRCSSLASRTITAIRVRDSHRVYMIRRASFRLGNWTCCRIRRIRGSCTRRRSRRRIVCKWRCDWTRLSRSNLSGQLARQLSSHSTCGPEHPRRPSTR